MNKQTIYGLSIAVSLLATAGVANATTVTVDGSYTTSYTPTKGNGPSISDDLNHSFTETLTMGTPTADLNFFKVTPSYYCGSCGSSDTATGTITVSFTFTEPTGATGSLTDTATYTADYHNDTDSVDWSSANDPIVVTFSNGDVLDVTLVNASDWAITPEISFDLTGPAATPLPATLPLFAGGLGLLGFFGRRKRKSA
jgi:PEP-CTERM motif